MGHQETAGMKKRVAFTQAQVRRIIQATRREGLRVAGIKPDGTVVVYDSGENPLAPVDGLIGGSEDVDAVRWGDGDG
jgi:hypothetical protein